MADTKIPYRDTPEELPEYTTEGINPLALEETFKELITGIVLSGGVFIILLWVFFPGERFYHVGGVLIGIILSLVMSVYLKRSVTQAVDMGQYGAEKVIKKGALIRYGIVCIVIGILMIWPLANPLTAFLGVMTLKVAAYIQPFTNKVLKILKIRR